MAKDPVGYRFSPTDEELIIYYLKNKIHGKTWLVDEAISEINICSHKPKFLPSLAKIKSDDLVWYFFCPREYISEKNKLTKRSTGFGFWKPTGKDRKIRDKRGKGVGVEIGLKKTLVYYEGKVPNEVRTPWVIHEYHITCLPENQRIYVICQVMYKGEDGDILYGINSNEPSHSLASVSNTFRAFNTVPEVQVEQPGEESIFLMSMDDLVNPVNVQEDLSLADGFNPNTLFSDNINLNLQPQTPYDDAYFNRVLSYNTGPDQLQVEENVNGLSVNDLLMPMNEHNDLAEFDPNTFLSGDYYNNNYNINPQPQTYDDAGFIEDQELIMQENRNENRPKKALSGIYVYSGSDSGSDAESISAPSYQGTSSPGTSVGSPIPSCSSTDSCKDLQTSISRKTKESQLTRRTVTSKQEVKQGTPRAVDASLVKTETKVLFILEDAMERNRKNPRYIYFINMIKASFSCCLSLATSYRFYYPSKAEPTDGFLVAREAKAD